MGRMGGDARNGGGAGGRGKIQCKWGMQMGASKIQCKKIGQMGEMEEKWGKKWKEMQENEKCKKVKSRRGKKLHFLPPPPCPLPSRSHINVIEL